MSIPVSAIAFLPLKNDLMSGFSFSINQIFWEISTIFGLHAGVVLRCNE